MRTQALYTCIFGAHGQFVVPYSLCEPGQCGGSSPCTFVQLCFQIEVVGDDGPELREFMDDLLYIVIGVNCGRVVDILNHHVCLLPADCNFVCFIA